MTVDTFGSPYITVIDDRDSKNSEVFSEGSSLTIPML